MVNPLEKAIENKKSDSAFFFGAMMGAALVASFLAKKKPGKLMPMNSVEDFKNIFHKLI